MKRKVLIFAMASLIAVAGAFVVSSPAVASLNDCPGGTGCVWAQTNYGGLPAVYSISNSGYDRCNNIPTSTPPAVAGSIEAIYGAPVLYLEIFSGGNCGGTASLKLKNGQRLASPNFSYKSYKIETK